MDTGIAWINRSELVFGNALDLNQLGVENQRRARWNRSNASIAVSILGGDRQLPLLANAHIQEALVPSALR